MILLVLLCPSSQPYLPVGEGGRSSAFSAAASPAVPAVAVALILSQLPRCRRHLFVEKMLHHATLQQDRHQDTSPSAFLPPAEVKSPFTVEAWTLVVL